MRHAAGDAHRALIHLARTHSRTKRRMSVDHRRSTSARADNRCVEPAAMSFDPWGQVQRRGCCLRPPPASAGCAASPTKRKPSGADSDGSRLSDRTTCSTATASSPALCCSAGIAAASPSGLCRRSAIQANVVALAQSSIRGDSANTRALPDRTNLSRAARRPSVASQTCCK
jgi:hypothetical protein